jgi:DNA-binding transcriptional LysR family regulator
VGELARAARSVLRPAAARLDLATLKRSFTIRANEGFVEAFAAPLIAAILAAAPGVRLRFAPKPDKDVAPLREGQIDLEIGVVGETAPELRVQALFQDHFVGVARHGHPLLAGGTVTPERYAACAHVVTSRRGRVSGPVDEALAALGLARRVVVVVPGFPAALAVVKASDLVTHVPHSFFSATRGRPAAGSGLESFPLPVVTRPIAVSQIWHPRLDADAAHRWLRKLVQATCREIVPR